MENINLNQSQCIKERYQFTGVTYVNVCNDTKTFVNYGSLDVLTGLFLVGTCFATCFVLYKIFKDVF